MVRPNVVDKDKGKGIIIDDPWGLDGNTKFCSREVVAEWTLDEGETLKIAIKSSWKAGADRQPSLVPSTHHGRSSKTAQTVRVAQADSPVVSRGSDDYVPSNHDDTK